MRPETANRHPIERAACGADALGPRRSGEAVARLPRPASRSPAFAAAVRAIAVAGAWARRTPAKALAVLVLGAALHACGAVTQTEEEHFQRGLELQAQGELRAAAIEFKNVLQQNPRNAEARLRLGTISLDLGDPAAAIPELERALQLGAASIPVQIGLARAWLIRGEYGRVLTAVDGALADGSDDRAELLSLRGDALYGLARYDEAEQAFDAALAEAPETVPALLGAARLALRSGRTEEARARVEQALRVNAASAAAWDLRGDVEQSAGDLEAAEAAYTEAIRHSQARYPYHLKRGLARLSRGDTAGAEADARALRAISVAHPATGYLEGVVHLYHQRPADAQKSLEQSLTRGADFLPSVYYLGVAHFLQGHWRQAEQQLTQYMGAYPSSLEAARLLAAVRLREGDGDRAAQLLEPLLQRRPDDLMALNLMGNLHLSRGQREEGLEHLRRAAAIRPDDPGQQASLAVALLRSGEASEGMQLLNETMERNPENAAQLEAVLTLELIRDRRFREALESAQRLADKHPAVPLPQILKGAAFAGLGDVAGETAALGEALRLDPGNPIASASLASRARQRGDIEEARRLYRQSLKHYPGELAILMHLAELESREGNAAEMRRLLDTAIERHPASPLPRLALGRYYLGAGEPRRALSLVEPLAGTEAGEDIQVLDLLANAQLASGQPQLATGTLRKLAARAPDTVETRFRLAQAFMRIQQFPDAAAQLRRVLAHDAGHVGALQSLARIEAREGRLDEALDLLRRAQRAAPDDPDGFAMEGEILTARGDHAAALRVFRKAYDLAPSADSALRVGGAHQRLGKPGDAIDFLAARLADHPDEDAVRLALAEVRVVQGHHEAAIADYEHLLAGGQDNVIVLNNLAFLYQGRDDARALELAERSHAAHPGNPSVADTLGWILVQRGDAERGLPLLRQARNGLPEHASVRYHYAYALARTGSRAEARREIAELLDKAGEFPERADAEALLSSLR